MKKSTILLVVVVYIVAFFVVGFFGIQVRSFYSVNYINEILVTPHEQTNVVLEKDERVTQGDESDLKSYRVTHDYLYTVNYTAGMTLVFNVEIIPDNSSISEYQWDHDENSEFKENNFYKIEKDSVDKTITISIKKKITGTFTRVKFSVWDSDQNGVKSNVEIHVL